MEGLLFGISGLPLGEKSGKFDYASGIAYVSALGLDAMELLFVRNVNVTDRNSHKIFKAKQDKDIYLSAHGSHYINLNAGTPEKQAQSIARILAACEGLLKVRGRSLVFHPGYYLTASKESAYRAIKSNLLKLPDKGVDYRLETTGRAAQFGTLEELVSLCKEIGRCELCIDFSHIHARHNGSLKGYDDFAKILQYVLDALGRPALDDLHMHIGGVRYSEKGELCHLPLSESDFNYIDCLKALKDFKASGCVIAEGPLVEKDALLLKKTYMAL